jgi:hypothetical protein
MVKPYQAVPNQSNTTSSEAVASDEQVLKPTPKPPDEKLLAVEGVWAYYIQKLGKNPELLSFTAGRKQKGLARLRECLEKEGGDLGRAEGLMRAAVDALAASPYHRGENPSRKRYDSWEKNLFKDQDQTENWLDSAKQGQFQKPQRSSENPGGDDARPYLEPMPPIPCAPRH